MIHSGSLYVFCPASPTYDLNVGLVLLILALNPTRTASPVNLEVALAPKVQ